MEKNDSPIPRDQKPLHPWVADWFRKLKLDGMTEKQWKVARASYGGLVAQLDRLVGRVLTAARSLPGETVIVYVSDHGEMAGDRGMFWKKSFFKEAVNVPMIWCPLVRQSDAFTRMIRQGPYKLIYYYRHEGVQLFDLQEDPQEQDNLGDSKVHMEVRNTLLSQLLNGWDPELIKKTADTKAADLKYWSQWGKQVGMGPLDLWDCQDLRI